MAESLGAAIRSRCRCGCGVGVVHWPRTPMTDVADERQAESLLIGRKQLYEDGDVQRRKPVGSDARNAEKRQPLKAP